MLALVGLASAQQIVVVEDLPAPLEARLAALGPTRRAMVSRAALAQDLAEVGMDLNALHDRRVAAQEAARIQTVSTTTPRPTPRWFGLVALLLTLSLGRRP